MITGFIILFVLTYSPTAVWAIRAGGLRRLWLLCALALLGVLALLLSAAYSVPSMWLVVLYLLGFVGPSILFATGSLTLANGLAMRSLPLQLIVAFAGSMIGVVVAITRESREAEWSPHWDAMAKTLNPVRTTG